MTTRTGSAVWTGGLENGSGRVSVQSGAFEPLPYGFKTRFEDEPGTNPEELVGAAHASCFAMALSKELGDAGIAATNIAASAAVTIAEDDGGFTITASRLAVQVFASDADEAKVEAAAEAAKEGCPVSKLLNAEVTLDLQVNP